MIFFPTKNGHQDLTPLLFSHIVEHNHPVTELISANYSFVNADLARIYRLEGVPEDSKLRQYTSPTGAAVACWAWEPS